MPVVGPSSDNNTTKNEQRRLETKAQGKEQAECALGPPLCPRPTSIRGLCAPMSQLPASASAHELSTDRTGPFVPLSVTLSIVTLMQPLIFLAINNAVRHPSPPNTVSPYATPITSPVFTASKALSIYSPFSFFSPDLIAPKKPRPSTRTCRDPRLLPTPTLKRIQEAHGLARTQFWAIFSVASFLATWFVVSKFFDSKPKDDISATPPKFEYRDQSTQTEPPSQFPSPTSPQVENHEEPNTPTSDPSASNQAQPELGHQEEFPDTQFLDDLEDFVYPGHDDTAFQDDSNTPPVVPKIHDSPSIGPEVGEVTYDSAPPSFGLSLLTLNSLPASPAQRIYGLPDSDLTHLFDSTMSSPQSSTPRITTAPSSPVTRFSGLTIPRFHTMGVLRNLDPSRDEEQLGPNPEETSESLHRSPVAEPRADSPLIGQEGNADDEETQVQGVAASMWAPKATVQASPQPYPLLRCDPDDLSESPMNSTPPPPPSDQPLNPHAPPFSLGLSASKWSTPSHVQSVRPPGATHLPEGHQALTILPGAAGPRSDYCDGKRSEVQRYRRVQNRHHPETQLGESNPTSSPPGHQTHGVFPHSPSLNAANIPAASASTTVPWFPSATSRNSPFFGSWPEGASRFTFTAGSLPFPLRPPNPFMAPQPLPLPNVTLDPGSYMPSMMTPPSTRPATPPLLGEPDRYDSFVVRTRDDGSDIRPRRRPRDELGQPQYADADTPRVHASWRPPPRSVRIQRLENRPDNAPSAELIVFSDSQDTTPITDSTTPTRGDNDAMEAPPVETPSESLEINPSVVDENGQDPFALELEYIDPVPPPSDVQESEPHPSFVSTPTGPASNDTSLSPLPAEVSSAMPPITLPELSVPISSPIVDAPPMDISPVRVASPPAVTSTNTTLTTDTTSISEASSSAAVAPSPRPRPTFQAPNWAELSRAAASQEAEQRPRPNPAVLQAPNWALVAQEQAANAQRDGMNTGSSRQQSGSSHQEPLQHGRNNRGRNVNRRHQRRDR